MFDFKNHSITDIDKGSINVMTVARLVPKKGHEYMIKALPAIIKKYPQVQYTIVGSGPLKKRLQKTVRKLRLTRNVRFVNAIPHHHLKVILEQAHIFVLPSVVDFQGDSESCPDVLKEAIALGVPVISTDHAGIPELVEHGVTGLLVQEKNVNALSNEVIYAIEHQEQCRKMAKKAYQAVLNDFDLKTQNNKLEQLLVQLL